MENRICKRNINNMGRPKKKILEAEDFIANPIKNDEKVVDEIVKDPIAELNEKFDKLVDVVGGLAERVIKKEEKQEVKSTPVDIEKDTPSDDIPVPPSWLKIMRDILGNDFTMKVVEGGHGDFVIDIYLPINLDRRNGSDRQPNTVDHSTGLVRRASVLADVETWCDKILTNIRVTHPDFKK